jgi:hypothetical protein
MSVCKRVQKQEPNFYADIIFKLGQKWDKYVNVLVRYVAK